MRITRIIPVVIAAALLAAVPVRAESPDGYNPDSVPRVSFGFGGGYGWHSLHNASSSGPGKVSGSEMYTGGLIFEGMISEHMGLHSGLWYLRETMQFDSMAGSDVKSDGTGISIPVLAVFPFHAWRFTFGFLAGIQFTLMTSSRYTITESGSSTEFEVLKFLNYQQLGVAGGAELKIALFRFVDFFVSALGEYNLTTFSSEKSDGAADHLYGYVIRTGFLFRTYHIF
jgi:hypothetical protein